MAMNAPRFFDHLKNEFFFSILSIDQTIYLLLLPFSHGELVAWLMYYPDQQEEVAMEARVETHPTTDKVVKTAHDTIDKAAGPAGHAEDRFRETSQKVQTSVKETAGKVQESTKELGHAMTEYIKQNPMTSVGIAAAVGLVIGALLRR